MYLLYSELLKLTGTPDVEAIRSIPTWQGLYLGRHKNQIDTICWGRRYFLTTTCGKTAVVAAAAISREVCFTKMTAQRSKEQARKKEKARKASEIFDQALKDSPTEIQSDKLVAEVEEGLDDRNSQREIFEACLEASKSYIDSDPGMREVAADIFLQKTDFSESADFFELYVEECSHAGPRN